MIIKVLSVATLLLFACKGDANKETGPAAQGKGSASSGKAESALPTTTATLALNTDGHAIPASIEMPTGSTIFADEPTRLRVGFDGKDDKGRRRSLFEVQIQEGNTFSLDLAAKAKELEENAYGNTNEILEQGENLLLYKTTTKDGFESHSFRVIVDLGAKKWVCTQGNDGGWSEEQARAQMAACKTIKTI